MNLRQRASHNKSGFTFIELTVAVLLLVTTSAGLYSVFVSANQWVKPHNAVAINMARERLEFLFEAIRQDWWDLSDKPLSLGGPYADGTITLDGAAYARAYTISVVPGKDYRKVEVSVTW